MMAAIVPTNTESKCQAFRVTPAGGGMNHSRAPIPIDIPKSFILAPHLNAGSDGAGAAAELANTFRTLCLPEVGDPSKFELTTAD
jgi:hypothetical protein